MPIAEAWTLANASFARPTAAVCMASLIGAPLSGHIALIPAEPAAVNFLPVGNRTMKMLHLLWRHVWRDQSTIPTYLRLCWRNSIGRLIDSLI
jgi:hypothetical protein